ncbi:MAG TPA: rRNA maturation RNase YbeY [Thermoanaerobacterales bacterium]|nr:rRNA maturation RNase YbeY [Thermoanaerobacterales bacterium]
MEISILNLQDKVNIEDDTINLLKKSIKYTLDKECLYRQAEVSIVLTDNEYIQELNEKYRGINTPTDVLSFPMIDDFNNITLSDETELLLGDIVISIEKVDEQSKEFGHSFNRELIFLAVHGLLHLLGYDHEDKEDEEKMRSKEKDILASINI